MDAAANDARARAAGAPSRVSVLVELVIVGAFAALFLLAFQTRPGYVDLVLAVVAVALIAAASGRGARIWATQGLPAAGYRERLRAATRATAAFTLPVAALFLAAGFVLGYAEGGMRAALERVADWHLVAAMLLYLPWAFLQQFVFQFYLLGRLLYLLPAPAAVALTGLAFSMVHFPRWPIMAATALGGVVWALIYRRHRSLPPLAVSHAVLGATLHYWVFGRDLLEGWLAL